MDRDSIMVTLLTVITVFAVLRKLRLRKKKQQSLLHDDDVLQMTRGPVPNSQDLHLCCSGLLPRDVLNDRSRIHDPNLIINSLDWILSRRFGSKVHSLDLICCLSKCVASRFEETVICSVERLRVEDFVLVCNCYSNTSHDLPFSCHFLSEMHSLKYFQLRLCSLHPSWKSQRNYSLQTLYLSEVTVSSGAVECVLSTCSMLHTLRIVNCKCPSKLRIRGIDLELKTLDVSACEDLEEIDFFAGNLVRFDFFNNRETVNIVFNHVPKLECILLKLGSNLEGSIIERRVLETIEEDLPHLKSLIIVIIEGDSLEERIGSIGINMFKNLRQLSINVYRLEKKIDLFVLTPLLQWCPCLQEFHVNLNNNEYDVAQGERKAIVFHTELKKMVFTGFRGMESEIEFATYILASATSLEKMVICRCTNVYIGNGKWFQFRTRRWSEETPEIIRTELQGKAVSKTAEVILQPRPVPEDCNENFT